MFESGTKPTSLHSLDPSLVTSLMDHNPQVRSFHVFLGVHLYIYKVYRMDRTTIPSDYQYRISTPERDNMVGIIQKWASKNLKNIAPWVATVMMFGGAQLCMCDHGTVSIYPS